VALAAVDAADQALGRARAGGCRRDLSRGQRPCRYQPVANRFRDRLAQWRSLSGTPRDWTKRSDFRLLSLDGSGETALWATPRYI
jgi:hypothetical protein